MNVWFTADQHFGHLRIIELAHRPFSSVEEMKETIIERFNQLVKPGDLTIHLGDFAMGQIKETLPLIQRLNGEHELILGNHDRPSPMYPHRGSEAEQALKRAEWKWTYLKAGFSQVQLHSRLSNHKRPDGNWDNEHQVWLYHLPFGQEDHMDGREDTLRAYRPVPPDYDPGVPLLHGHIHDLRRTSGRQFNVGVDVNDFRPVSMEEIDTWLKSL